MNITQIENNLSKLIKNFNKESFIYDLLLAYNLPKATIAKLKRGNLNLSKAEGEVSLKKKLFFKEVYDEDLHLCITNIAKEIKHDQRFVIVTDYQTLLAKDTKTNTTLDIPLKDLPKNYDFFLPWAGMEKAQYQDENPADIKAAVKMAKLFDEIKNDNPDNSKEFIHELNVFLSRLLFCFFAEDTNIFKDNQFTNGIASHTQPDGTDLNKYLDTLFDVLNTPYNKRVGLPEHLNLFPYVNGGLFAKKIKTPNFSSVSRKVLIESGSQNWSDINPDIFGSMFQAVISVDQRGSLGQHYTSVPNIMKVIEPLFLNDLKEEFENAKGNNKKLNQLLYRLKNIKIFDPACGSGNFLIIAYKELRRLEMEIFKEIGSLALSEISLSQFYGIELDDFAHEIAILALWLTKHQMNVEFFKEFGRTTPTLPLTDAVNIVQGNACRIDWEEVCPKTTDGEIYILGNPPYIGFQNQDETQKNDIKDIFQEFKNFKRIDYIGCWLKIATDYIYEKNAAYSFVSTNSICQGEQVSIIWPYILGKRVSLFFAHQSFNWGNNAKNKAKVTCVIIGLKNESNIKHKYIYTESTKKNAKNISPYLIDTNTVIPKARSTAISSINKMSIGNVPLDGNNFILSKEEAELFCTMYPKDKDFVKKYMGASDFMKSSPRYCIWVTDKNKSLAIKNEFIVDRIEKCRLFRSKGGVVARQHEKVSYRFRTQPHQETNSIIFPKTTSSRREYIPAGFLDASTIISEKALASYNAQPHLFSILSSKMHILWLSITSSRMRNDYQYSVQLTYNTFPFPDISKQRKEELTQCTLNIIDERLKHSEKTLAQLYDPDKMPEGLRESHHQNDLAVERCYRSTPFRSDEERLEYLFKLYEKMIQEEKDKDPLFAKEKKTRKIK